MTERPKIPYDPQPNHPGSDAKRDVRELSEAGKLTSPGKRIPHYGKANGEDKRHGA